MLVCPYCTTENIEKYKFCMGCERQIRCTDCGEILLPDKSLCLECGTPLKVVAPIEANLPAPMNKFRMEKKQSNSSSFEIIEAEFTNEAAHLGFMFWGGQMPNSQRNSPSFTVNPAKTPKILPSNPEPLLPPKTGTPASDGGQFTESNFPDQDSDAQPFVLNDKGDDLIPNINDFKGANIKEQLRNFATVYIAMHDSTFGYGPSMAQVLALAKAQNLDSNFTKNMKSMGNLFIEQGGRLRLTSMGKNVVSEVNAALPDHTKSGFAYWDDGQRRKVKSVTRGKDEIAKAKEWLNRDLDLGGFDIRTLSTHAQRCMFVIWVLTKKLEVDAAVSASAAYFFLTEKFKTISMNRKAFTDTVAHLPEQKVGRNTDHKLYMNPDGEKEVRTWVEKGGHE